MKKFAEWMAGGKGPSFHRKGKASQYVVKLKILNKRLAKRAGSLGFKADQARRKAIDARRRGDVEGSRMQMRQSLQYAKWRNGVEAFRLRLEGLSFKLQQAKALQETKDVLVGIAGTIAGLQRAIKAPQIEELIREIGLGMENLEVTQEIAEEGMDAVHVDTEVTDDQVDQALAEVDAEIMVESGQALPSPAGSTRIKELEEELRKLKEER